MSVLQASETYLILAKVQALLEQVTTKIIDLAKWRQNIGQRTQMSQYDRRRREAVIWFPGAT